MSELRELYQALILDHGRRPRNFEHLPCATTIKEGFNPLCGDRIVLFFKIQDEVIGRITFQGCGCAISIASTSLMIESLQGKTITQAKELFHNFYQMVMQPDDKNNYENMGKLMVLKGVAEFPARVKCATLAWHTMLAALENNQEPVSTE